MAQATGQVLAWEDSLTYLPRKPVQEFARGRTIYDPQQPCSSLYVVILGRVKISHLGTGGSQTIVRIAAPEDLFGEWALIGTAGRNESAVALDHTTVMSWSREEIEQHIEREPRLGLALAQHLVRQSLDLLERMESMAVYKTPERVVLALLRLAESLGSAQPDGSARVASLTHHTIAQYVGTSREIVTFQMNRLRRMGLLRYSRQHLDIYPQALRETLREARVGAMPRPRKAGAAPA